MQAAEKRCLADVIARLPQVAEYARTLSVRLETVRGANHGRRVLEIGAAAGSISIALNRLGYECTGLEPDPDALKTAHALADTIGCRCPVVEGFAENLPFPDGSFDIVIANSVLEHVSDLERCLDEVARVLAPGGVFWFQTASSMSPLQHEIAAFPLFGWYPHWLKLKIMWWAVRARPELVGNTVTPAIHWFSDAFTADKLGAAGFGRIFDRWDLRRPEEGSPRHARALRMIRGSRTLRRLANVAVSECAYAAIKPDTRSGAGRGQRRRSPNTIDFTERE
jgi:ubiquinone/menaquinone biosynthesis C-methylase UbiE